MHTMSRSAEFVVRLLAKTGAATFRQLQQVPDPISRRWLSSWARDRGLVVVATACYRGRDVQHVTLTTAGKQVAREFLGLMPYRTTPAQLIHDLTLAGYYLRLPVEAQDTWRNPEELLACVTARYRKRVAASYPDGLYDMNGKTFVVEVAGAKLTRIEIEKKKHTAWSRWDVQDLVVVKAGEYANVDF